MGDRPKNMPHVDLDSRPDEAYIVVPFEPHRNTGDKAGRLQGRMVNSRDPNKVTLPTGDRGVEPRSHSGHFEAGPLPWFARIVLVEFSNDGL